MENNQINNSGNRKKLLVPLVVLLLCGVALTGAAYAYSTSVTVNDNPVAGDYYSIDMYDAPAASTAITEALEADSDFKVYTTHTVGGQYVAGVEGGTFERTVYVKITSDNADFKYTIKAPTCTYTAATGNLADIAIAFGSAAITKVSDNSAVTPGTTQVNAGDVLKIVLTFNVTADDDVGSFASVSALASAIDGFNGKFALTVSADRVIA